MLKLNYVIQITYIERKPCKFTPIAESTQCKLSNKCNFIQFTTQISLQFLMVSSNSFCKNNQDQDAPLLWAFLEKGSYFVNLCSRRSLWLTYYVLCSSLLQKAFCWKICKRQTFIIILDLESYLTATIIFCCKSLSLKYTSICINKCDYFVLIPCYITYQWQKARKPADS